MINVEIDNFQCNYHIPRAEKSPHKLQERFDSIAKNLLVKECDRVLSNTFADDGSLIFIKDLSMMFSLNTSELDNRALAEIWAKEIATAIVNAAVNPNARNNLIRYPNRPEYLTSFIFDLLRGVAWQKWYYQGLEHFRKFDNRGLIKELLGRNREITEDILLLITEKNSLGEFLRVLEDPDIKIIYEDYLDVQKRHDAKSYKELIEILTKILDESTLYLQGEKSCSFKNYLSLYLRALQRYPELRSVAAMKRAVKLTLLLREFLRRYETAEVLNSIIEQRDLDRFISFVRAKKDRELSGLSGLINEVIGSEGKRALLDIVKEVKGKAKAASKDKMVTPYGGLFLLIRTILETKLHLIIAASPFPEWENLPKTKAFLLFLAQKIAGQKDLLYEGIDPGLLFFAGYKNPPMPSLLKDYIQAITPEMNGRFLESLLIAFPQAIEAVNRDLAKKHADIDFETILSITKKLIYMAFTSRLRRFENSKPEYIFNNFLYRQSELVVGKDCINVKLSKKPLDIILRMSGFTEDIDRVPWLDNIRLRFTFEH